MNTIVKFYFLGLEGITVLPLWFDVQTLTTPGTGEVVDPGKLDFSKTETSGHLVTIGVL